MIGVFFACTAVFQRCKLLRKYGLGTTQAYLRANENAVQKYREICINYNCEDSLGI